MDAELQQAYKDAQDWADAEIVKALANQQLHDRPQLPTNITGYGHTTGGAYASDQTTRLAELRGLRNDLAIGACQAL
jgi:hypothetical protein